MKIVVLNGSPKGDISVTMQYVAYIRKKFADHEYEILNVAHEIKKIERDTAAWDRIIAAIRSADLVVWAFPLYYLLVCSQYKRFIELIAERNATDVFAGKYAVSLSTSIHFFDQTAHAYIRAVNDDLGMKYLGGYSAEMHGSFPGEGAKTARKICVPDIIRSTDNRFPSSRRTRRSSARHLRMFRAGNRKPFRQEQKKWSFSPMTMAVRQTLRL